MASEAVAALRRALLALGLCAPFALGATVYHTPEEALRVAFPSAERFESEPRPLGDALRARVSKTVGYSIREHLVTVTEAWEKGALLGRAIVMREIAKTLPFSFLVALRPDGAVDQVLLLTYREPRGEEIAREVFRDQYRGKTLADPIRRGRDIRNISGATISVDALSRGVRRALALLDALSPSPGAMAKRSPEAPKGPAR